MKSRSRFLLPLLFAVNPVLHLVSKNFYEIWFQELFLLLSGLALLSWLGTWAVGVWLKNPDRAAIHVAFFFFLFFSFGHVYNIFKSRLPVFPVPFGLEDSAALILLGMFACLYAAGVVLFETFSRFFSQMYRFLFLFGIFFLLVNGAAMLPFFLEGPFARQGLKPGGHPLEKPLPKAPAPASLPDIYEIILDAYGGEETLSRAFSYDNRDFLDFLRQHGFYLPQESYSNYQSTTKSFASFLNGEFLEEVARNFGSGELNSSVLFKAIEQSRFIQYLKSRGYAIIYFRSPFSIVDRMPCADLQIHCVHRYDLALELIRTSLLVLWKQPLFRHFEEDFRSGFLCTYQKLPQMADLSGPKFVFAHIVSPHPPYLFDAQGRPKSSGDLKLTDLAYDDRNDYVDQLKFVNAKMKEVISGILARNPQNEPVILIHADHGPPLQEQFFSGPQADYRKLRLDILYALHLPSTWQAPEIQRLSLVNSFPWLLNRLFGADFSLKKDRGYFSPANDWNHEEVELFSKSD